MNDNIRRAENDYLIYLKKHKQAVMAVWKDLCEFMEYNHQTFDFFPFEPFKTKEVKYLWVRQRHIQDIINLISLHDNSKFSEPEYTLYRKYFFSINPEEKISIHEIKPAFHSHYIRNPHHYQHWFLGDDFYEIPFKYIIEMMCDWASFYFPESPKQNDQGSFKNFIKNRNIKDFIHPRSFEIIERWCPIFDILIKKKSEEKGDKNV